MKFDLMQFLYHQWAKNILRVFLIWKQVRGKSESANEQNSI